MHLVYRHFEFEQFKPKKCRYFFYLDIEIFLKNNFFVLRGSPHKKNQGLDIFSRIIGRSRNRLASTAYFASLFSVLHALGHMHFVRRHFVC